MAAALLAAPASAEIVSHSTIASVGAPNALSTPAARHLVRMDSGTYLLALQRDGVGSGAGLSLYRSDDDARSWSLYASIAPDPAQRLTADVLKVGDDLAMVLSFDAPSILPDPALDRARKVYFQWWRGDGAGDWAPTEPVTVFDPEPGTAYHRGEVAIDSSGRIWVQAFKRGASACDPARDPRCAPCDVVANGDNYQNEIVVSVSEDGGRSFGQPRSLGTTLCRAGGRLIAAGTRVLLVWNDYSANENGTRIVTRFVEREAADPLPSWSAPKDAFPDEPADGVYHGAALSAVADGASVHLVYKDQNRQRLWYRRFDVPTSSFGRRLQVDDGADDWALQPAATLRDGELFILANRRVSEGSYQTRLWALSTGLGADAATTVPVDDAFHAYPTLPETLPRTARTLPYVYARAASAGAAGDEVALRIALDRPAALLSLDTRATLSAGKSIAIRVQTLKVAGVRGPVTFDLAGLPDGVRAAFDPPQVAPGEISTLALAADPGATSASAACQLAMTAGGARATIPFQLELKAAPAVELRGAGAGALLTGVAHVEVVASATPGLSLQRVRLLLDGEEVAAADSAPASFSLDTRGVADGAHDLAAVAVDEIGNSTRTAPLRVVVRNGGGGCASAAGEPLFAVAGLLAAAQARRRQRRRDAISSGCRAG
jgi:hypothetical protein